MQRWTYHQAIRLFFDSQRSLSSGHNSSRSRAIFGSATALYVLVSKVTAIGVLMPGLALLPPGRVRLPRAGQPEDYTAQLVAVIDQILLGPLRPELIIRAVPFDVAGKAKPLYRAPYISAAGV
jgi:hypothetical protein